MLIPRTCRRHGPKAPRSFRGWGCLAHQVWRKLKIEIYWNSKMSMERCLYHCSAGSPRPVLIFLERLPADCVPPTGQIGTRKRWQQRKALGTSSALRWRAGLAEVDRINCRSFGRTSNRNLMKYSDFSRKTWSCPVFNMIIITCFKVGELCLLALAVCLWLDLHLRFSPDDFPLSAFHAWRSSEMLNPPSSQEVFMLLSRRQHLYNIYNYMLIYISKYESLYYNISQWEVSY